MMWGGRKKSHSSDRNLPLGCTEPETIIEVSFSTLERKWHLL
jgi:hypothetical protein